MESGRGLMLLKFCHTKAYWVTSMCLRHSLTETWLQWALTSKQECKDHYELVERMAQDILHHRPWDERLVSTIGLPKQEGLSGWFRSQSQGRQRVHDEVYPQHLHRLKWRVLEKTGFLIDIHNCSGRAATFGKPLGLQRLKGQNRLRFMLISL